MHSACLLYFKPILFAQITHPYANGAFEANHKKLQKNFELLLAGVTLRTALDQISSNSGVVVWLDRRVDGEQVVDIRGDATMTYEQTLQELAEKNNLNYTWVGTTPYLCRQEDAQQVDLTYWQVATIDEGSLLKKSSLNWQWNNGEEPRKLLERIATDHALEIDQLERIDHDMWMESSLARLILPQASHYCWQDLI